MKKLLDWSEQARPLKAKVREIVLNPLIGPKKSPLLMPGNMGRDLYVAIKNGIVTQHSVPLCVERDPHELASFKEKLPDLLPPGYQQPKLYLSSLSDVILPGPIDYAWIDLFGNINTRDVHWIQDQLIPNMTKDMDLSFTFAVARRGNPFVTACLKILENHRDYFRDESSKYPLDLPQVLVPMVIAQVEILRFLFQDYSFEWEIFHYQDREPDAPTGYRMTLFHMSHFRRNRQKPQLFWPAFADVLRRASNSKTTPEIPITGNRLIDLLLTANTPARLATANRLLKQFVASRLREDPSLNPTFVRAGVLARVTRLRNAR